MWSRHQRRGLTIVEAALVCACAAALTAATVISVASEESAARELSKSVKDGIQLRKIHEGVIIRSRDTDGWYLRPGLVDADGSRYASNAGERIGRNTSANLYSRLIMLNFFTPSVVVSPVERNPRVTVYEAYRWDALDPDAGVYWDDRFRADLDERSHTSYAHLVLFGERVRRQWRETYNSTYPVFSNRGPEDGERDPDSHTCGPHGHWAGNVVFNDNHVKLHRTPRLEAVRVRMAAEPKRDNIFAMESGAQGDDPVLAITKSMASSGPELQYD